VTSTPEECFRSARNRLEAIRMALEENELPLCFDELERARKDMEYGLRLLNEQRT